MCINDEVTVNALLLFRGWAKAIAGKASLMKIIGLCLLLLDKARITGSITHMEVTPAHIDLW